MPHINTTGISENPFIMRFMLFVFQNCAFLFFFALFFILFFLFLLVDSLDNYRKLVHLNDSVYRMMVANYMSILVVWLTPMPYMIKQ